MINLDELEGVCDAMIEEGLDWCPPAGCGSAVQVKELIGLLREEQKGAERYRWLRNCAKEHELDVITCLGAMEWDGFIDEAMSHEAS